MSKIDVGVFMNTQIAEILEGSIDPWGERNANDLAEEILDLLKQEGWLHKDDPVKGLKVERGWSNIVSDDIGLKQKRPLTVGEALEMLPNMVYLLSEKVNDPLYRDALTTKDGGIVEVKG